MAFSAITVTRSYLQPNLQPAKGKVTFIPSFPMVNSGTVVAAPVVFQLVAGMLGALLAATDDPDTLPDAVTYLVREQVDGQPERRYYVEIPYNAAGGTVDLSTLASVGVPPTVVFPTPVYTDEQVRDVVGTTLAAGPGAAIAVNDAANTITIGADLPEFSSSAQTAAVSPASGMVGRTTRYDTTSGAITQTLPAATAGAVFAAGWDAGTNALTLTAAGSDVIGSGAATSVTVPLSGEVITYHCTTAGRWRVVGGFKSASALDARYALLGQGAVAAFARQRATVITNFESGHGWTIQSAGGGTSDLNDASDYLFGTQAVRLTTAGAGASVILTKSGLPALPTDRMYRLWVKATAANTLAQVRIFAASDSGFTNYYTFAVAFSSASIPEAERPFKAGEWVPIALPRSLMTATGSPDVNALTHARVLVNDRNTAVAATVRLGRLETVPYPGTVYPSGVVSFTYDDTFASHFTVARAHLDKYNFAGTLFPILDRIGQSGYLTQAQIDELVRLHGWEVGAHATTLAKHQQSLPAMTSAERTAEFTALRAWQQARGYDSPSLAYPSGLVDVATNTDMRPFYSVGRLALGRFSGTGADDTQNPSLPTRLYSQNPTNLTLAQMTAEVDRAVTNKTWLSFTFHDLVVTKSAANDVTIADHLSLIDYCATAGIAVRTMAEVQKAHVA